MQSATLTLGNGMSSGEAWRVPRHAPNLGVLRQEISNTTSG